MGFWKRFPYTNFHELNADWLIKSVKTMENRLKRIVTSVNGSTGDVVIPIPSSYNGLPSDLGIPAPGSGTSYALGNHVHKLPTYTDLGPADFLEFDTSHMTISSDIKNVVVYFTVWPGKYASFALSGQWNIATGGSWHNVITLDAELTHQLGKTWFQTMGASNNIITFLQFDSINHPDAAQIQLRTISNSAINSYFVLPYTTFAIT